MCVRQQRPGPSSSVFSPAAVRGNTIGASHVRLSSGLRLSQDATTGLAAQARSGNSGDAPSDAHNIHLSGVVVDPDAFDAAFPGLLTGAAGAELVVHALDHSSATQQGVTLVPHNCTVTSTSPQLRHPSITIHAPSSLGEALALQPGSILDLQLSGGQVLAEVAGWLRAPPPPADTVTLARVVVLGDLYVSPEVTMTTSHAKWRTPIRIRREIVDQLLGSQARSKVLPGTSYDVHSAIPPGQSPAAAAAAAAGAGCVVATLILHMNESNGTSYWRLLDGIHRWAKRLGGVGGDALQLALAVGGIQEVGGKDTLVKTCITARLVKRTTGGGVAAAAADIAPPEAAVEPPPPPAAAAGVAPAPSSTPAAVAPGSIARPRRSPSDRQASRDLLALALSINSKA